MEVEEDTDEKHIDLKDFSNNKYKISTEFKAWYNLLLSAEDIFINAHTPININPYNTYIEIVSKKDLDIFNLAKITFGEYACMEECNKTTHNMKLLYAFFKSDMVDKINERYAYMNMLNTYLKKCLYEEDEMKNINQAVKTSIDEMCKKTDNEREAYLLDRFGQNNIDIKVEDLKGITGVDSLRGRFLTRRVAVNCLLKGRFYYSRNKNKVHTVSLLDIEQCSGVLDEKHPSTNWKLKDLS